MGEGILYHEIAHFYLTAEFGPVWLFEGGANLTAEYVRARTGPEAWDWQLHADEYHLMECQENGVSNIHALSDPDHPDKLWQSTCQYSLGQYFMTKLFNTITVQYHWGSRIFIRHAGTVRTEFGLSILHDR